MLTSPERKHNLSVRGACFLMTAITIARGSSFLLSKYLLNSMEPLNLLGLRFLLAFIVLFLLFFRKVIHVIKTDPTVIGAAVLLGSVYYLCMASELCGLRYTTSSACSFLENTAIVMVPIMVAVLLRKKPRPEIIASTIITVTGIGLIVLNGCTSSYGNSSGIGNILCMAHFFVSVSGSKIH